MCSVFLLRIFSPDIFALLCLSASQVTSRCLKTTTQLPQLPISLLLLMRLLRPPTAAWMGNKTVKYAKPAFINTNKKKKKNNLANQGQGKMVFAQKAAVSSTVHQR